jgi:toxin CcdB
MARFDVYAHPDAAVRKTTPYLLDVQNEFISGLDTRVVVPLRKAALFKQRLRDLHPEIDVNGVKVVMDTPALAAFPARELGQRVLSARSQQPEIAGALDSLFGGY